MTDPPPQIQFLVCSQYAPYSDLLSHFPLPFGILMFFGWWCEPIVAVSSCHSTCTWSWVTIFTLGSSPVNYSAPPQIYLSSIMDSVCILGTLWLGTPVIIDHLWMIIYSPIPILSLAMFLSLTLHSSSHVCSAWVLVWNPLQRHHHIDHTLYVPTYIPNIQVPLLSSYHGKHHPIAPPKLIMG